MPQVSAKDSLLALLPGFSRFLQIVKIEPVAHAGHLLHSRNLESEVTPIVANYWICCFPFSRFVEPR